jgi:PAS domain S-box-containing protein
MDLGEGYRLLAETVDAAVFITDPQGRMVYANAGLEKLTGYTAADFQFPQADNPFLHREDAARVGKFIADFFASGAPISEPIENRFCDRWGQTRVYRSVLSRIRFDGQEAIQFVTRPVPSTAPVAELLRDYRAIVHSAGDGIVKLDAMGRFHFANERFQDLVGRDAVGLGRMRIAQVIPAEDDEGRYLVPGRFEGRLVKEGGDAVSVEVVVTSLDPEPEVLAIVRDVTHKRQLEQELERRQRLESLGLLAGGIAHDFNNLLTVIGANAALAERSVARGRDSRESLREILLACTQAGNICQRLLAAAGRARVTRARLDVAALAVEVVELVRSSVPPEARLSVVTSGPAPIEGDAGALQSLLMNLLTNAVEALGARAGRVSVTVDALECERDVLSRFDGTQGAAPGRYARLRVADTGAGLDEATRARMFDPFFTTKSAGHGLGLSAVLGTVRAHGGGIAVESTVGQGTTFDVLIPIAVAPSAPPPASRVAQSRRGEGRTILVADDEDAVRRTVARMLEDAGYHVIAVRDGLEAISAVRARGEDITVVLLDAVMPHAGGLAAALEIRGFPRRLPIVIMTGYTTDDFRMAGVEVLAKPFSVEELLAVLDRAVAEA